MLPIEKCNQYGILRENGLNDIKCIIIHNSSSIYSANEIYNYLENISKENECCNYIVDFEDLIQVVPDEWGCFNTGKGNDYACKYGISIMICSNNDDSLYLRGQNNAIDLIKELMNKYNIPKSEIYFHKDFNESAYCPADILRLYGNKNNFINSFINGGE